MVLVPPQAWIQTGRGSRSSSSTSTIRRDPGVTSSISPSAFTFPSKRARLQELRRGIARVVLDQVRMDLGVGLQVRLHPVVTGPLVALPVVLRARRDDALDVPLVGIEEEPDHRALVVDLAVAGDDHARPVGGAERIGGGRHGREEKDDQSVLHPALQSVGRRGARHECRRYPAQRSHLQPLSGKNRSEPEARSPLAGGNRGGPPPPPIGRAPGFGQRRARRAQAGRGSGGPGRRRRPAWAVRAHGPSRRGCGRVVDEDVEAGPGDGRFRGEEGRARGGIGRVDRVDRAASRVRDHEETAGRVEREVDRLQRGVGHGRDPAVGHGPAVDPLPARVHEAEVAGGRGGGRLRRAAGDVEPRQLPLSQLPAALRVAEGRVVGQTGTDLTVCRPERGAIRPQSDPRRRHHSSARCQTGPAADQGRSRPERGSGLSGGATPVPVP